MIKNIITEPEPILRKKGREITPADFNDSELKLLISDLIETLYATSNGVGIAAPQIGQSVQVCVIAKDYTEKKDKDLVLINPVWHKLGLTKVWGEEGCFSVPNTFGKVKRYKKIKINALDENGKQIQFEASGFFARIIQHEVDHLNGILFIDKAKNIYRTDNLL